MINTRLSIFKTLLKKLKGLTKHGLIDPVGFKKILYGVILNDMKEWSEYIPNNDNEKIVKILNDYILNNKEFLIERFIADPDLYKNTNTPQDNTTWGRIWDNKNSKTPSVVANPTFRFQADSKDSITVYKVVNAKKVPNENALTMELHDKTLFENGRDEYSNPNLVPIQ